MQERLAVCALNMLLRYNGDLARRIISFYGSAAAVFEEDEEKLTAKFPISKNIAKQLLQPETIRQAEEELEWVEKKHIELCTFTEPQFPQTLLNTPDHPLLLYSCGSNYFNNANYHFLSVVGTREATPYGIEACSSIIADLSQRVPNCVIVSGLAFGIDATAHKSAIENHLPTIAVLPNGLDHIYPATHRPLAKEIIKNGACVTEFPSHSDSFKCNFIQRNRIIAGLSEATLVIESKEDGGALITAHLANEYNRDVLALPGRINDLHSKGTNNLIKENKAALVTCAKDIIDALFWDSQEPKEHCLPLLDATQQIIADAINSGCHSIDEIHEKTAMPIDQLGAKLSEMEIFGIVTADNQRNYKLAL